MGFWGAFLATVLSTSPVFAKTINGCFDARSASHLRHADAVKNFDGISQTVFGFGVNAPQAGRSFAYYPTTVAVSSQHVEMLKKSSDPSMKKSQFLWANRCVNVPGLPIPRGSDCPASRAESNKGNAWDFKLRNANGTPEPRRVWAYFSTYDKAMACNVAQVMGLLGVQRWQAQAKQKVRQAGLRYVSIDKDKSWESPDLQLRKVNWVTQDVQARWQSVADQIGAIQFPLNGDNYVADTCVVWSDEHLPLRERLVRQLNGITLDYEVADLRTPAQTVALIRAIREKLDAVKKFRKDEIKFQLFVNPLNRAALMAGVNEENLREILHLVDYLPVSDTRLRNDSDVEANLYNQLNRVRASTFGRHSGALTKAELRKIYLVFDLSEQDSVNKVDAARAARRFIRSSGIRGGVQIWRNGTQLQTQENCETDSWRAVACVTFGKCS